MIPDQHKKKAAWVAVCVACVSGFEGLRQVAYNDPVGIPTVCFGETKGVKLGDRYTVDECKDMLADSLQIAAEAVDRCTRVPLTDARRAALVSFAYNVGGGAYCGSTVARKLNQGDIQGGCDALLLWRKAQGLTLPGLLIRREKERQLCLQGVT